ACQCRRTVIAHFLNIKSLIGYILADKGYDVWLGNVRGNIYSKKHVNLTIKDAKFWDFSWQDIAEYDLPAMINFILNKTGTKQIVYVGHSQGTLIGFAKFSTDLEFAKKIKLFVALAPVSTVYYITTPVRYLAPFSWPIEKTLELFGDYSFGSITWILNYVKPACEFVPEGLMLCENIIFFLAGPESKRMLNQTRIPVYLAHNPDDTSMKNLVHYAQMVNTGKMQKYDYGFIKNLMVYGQTWPPEYQIERMEVDTVAFYSPRDAFADDRDVLPLLNKIRKLKKVYRLDQYSHLDFLWALDSVEKVYTPMMRDIENLDSNYNL
uniref:AB hydrolase-1 domain-containing protein n=1 Tax=Romanomermis culicivorax TaxID=13658 RepID=A0A915JYM4_ROMCU